MKRVFLHSELFRCDVSDQISIALACLSPRWQNHGPNRLHRDLARRTLSQQLVILALDFLTMLNTLRVVMTMPTTLWNSGRGYDRHPRAEKWMLVLPMNTYVKYVCRKWPMPSLLLPAPSCKVLFLWRCSRSVCTATSMGSCALFLTLWTMLL